MMNVAVIVGLAFGLCRAGIIRSYGPDPMDACTVCATEEKGVLYCRGERVAAVISVEACPGGQLWTDGDILVTGLRGSVERVRLTRTTLACDMFPTSEAVLNGQKCLQSSETDSTDRAGPFPSTTTTAKPFPWWPIPFGVEGEVANVNTTTTAELKTTTGSNTTTTSSGTTSATYTTSDARDVSTAMIAVTAGLSLNGTLVIITVGVTITATAILFTLRCVRKRAARRSVPVQVGEVSSTTSFVGPSSSGVGRRSGGSWESIELFKRD